MTPTVHFEAASTLAVVVSSNGPLLFLSDDQTVIAASASFCRAFGIDPVTVCGQSRGNLGNGEWAMPKLASLLRATASGSAKIEAYEIDLKRPGQKTRQLVVNAQKLNDGDADRIRVLVAITDVTEMREEARLKEDLVRGIRFCRIASPQSTARPFVAPPRSEKDREDIVDLAKLQVADP